MEGVEVVEHMFIYHVQGPRLSPQHQKQNKNKKTPGYKHVHIREHSHL